VTVAVEDFRRLRVQDKQRRTKSKFWGDKGYGAQLESFINRIRKGESPEVTAHDGARATVACLRMLESARTLGPRAIDFGELK
jgi:predicted dehydrogenase